MVEMVEDSEGFEWKRIDSGEIFKCQRHNLPIGAMFYRNELEGIDEFCGDDGKSLCVILPGEPGNEWMIDYKASNCGLPNDKVHKCWCRHGIPPLITVDKNCNSCNAGAGSIQRGNYHGFLRNGELVPC